MEKEVVSIKEAAVLFGLGNDAVYRAAKSGQIPTIKVGGRILIPKAVMLRLLADPGLREAPVEAAVGSGAVEEAG